MQGIIGAIILGVVIAILEIRSRRNGHFQRKQELQQQINRIAVLHTQCLSRQNLTQELSSMTRKSHSKLVKLSG